MRFAFAAFVAVSVAGCSQAPKPVMQAAAPQQYIAIVQHGAEQCYVRYLDAIAADSVCIRGADVRYSAPPAAAVAAQIEIPVVALALFSEAKLEIPPPEQQATEPAAAAVEVQEVISQASTHKNEPQS